MGKRPQWRTTTVGKKHQPSIEQPVKGEMPVETEFTAEGCEKPMFNPDQGNKGGAGSFHPEGGGSTGAIPGVNR